MNTPDYYLQKLEEFDGSVYPQKDYSKGTTAVLDQISEAIYCHSAYIS